MVSVALDGGRCCCAWGGAGDSVIGVYERAMAQVWLRLEALAQQHGVMDQLQVFVSVGPLPLA